MDKRVKHYEAYLKKFNFITLPGLVDDGKTSVSKKYKAKYTSIYTIGLDGKIKYRKDFPSNWSNAYKELNNKIKELLPATPIVENKQQKPFALIMNHTIKNGLVQIQSPDFQPFTVHIVKPSGRQILSQHCIGSLNWEIRNHCAPGIYYMKVKCHNSQHIFPMVLQ